MRQLMKQNAGVSNIEITDSNIKAFESTAKKYNIDFSLKKVKGEQTRYLVFFKGRDADVMTAAFQEFSAKKLNREKKPSIRKALAAAKDKMCIRDRIFRFHGFGHALGFHHLPDNQVQPVCRLLVQIGNDGVEPAGQN